MTSKFRKYTKSWIKKETDTAKKIRSFKAVRLLKKRYPKSKIALNYKTNMQLLASVILSAQCTDKKVNEVTYSLFKKYKTPRDFAHAKRSVFEKEIRQTGFYRVKAKHIIEGAIIIKRDFKSKLPKAMDDMLGLPGVARKTANIVLKNAYGVIEGIPVDTHVGRISQRLGFADSGDPQKIETALMKLIPKKEWGDISYFIIEHGRTICTSRRRKCNICPLKKICPSEIKET